MANIPYTLYLIPYTLYPTPYTLSPLSPLSPLALSRLALFPTSNGNRSHQTSTFYILHFAVLRLTTSNHPIPYLIAPYTTTPFYLIPYTLYLIPYPPYLP